MKHDPSAKDASFSSSTSAEVSGSPWGLGLRAARANLVPGLIIQGFLVALSIGYYKAPAVRGFLEHLAAVKAEHGYLFSFIAGGLAGGALPELFVIGLFQRGKCTFENLRNLAVLTPFWGVQSVLVDALYRWQGWYFGEGDELLLVAKKVMVDQWLFTPFVAIPSIVGFVDWRAAGYSRKALRAIGSLRFFKMRVFPTVLAAWGVWTPIVCIVYSLPSPLQTPFFSLALTFWGLILLWIARHQSEE